ncbi:hypothetical protein Tco_0530401 [Tanacetum coccineum]
MLKEFNKCISERTNPLPITKIIYVVNSSKTATMRITRDKDHLNLQVYPDFRLRMLGFSEWLEVLIQAKRLGLPPPPELATFKLTTKEKKRKRTEFLKEMFVTEDVRVDRMNRNLIPPLGVVLIEGLVIKEPKLSIKEPAECDQQDSLSAKPQRATSDIFKSRTLSDVAL